MSKSFIYLRGDQFNVAPYSHPMIKHGEDHRIDDEKTIELMEVYLDRDSSEDQKKESLEKLILGNVYIITHLIGRYVRNWPDSSDYIDDMYSEGLLSLTEQINKIDQVDLRDLRAKIVVRAKLAIEEMLNSLRFPIHASVRTQFRRIKEGSPPEYGGDIPLSSKYEVPVEDGEYMVIDLLDALESLRECDTEEMIDLVLLALEQQHNIRKQDIKDEDRELIEQLVKLGGQHVFSV